MNSELVTVRSFSFRPEADLAQQLLEAAGIPSFVRDDGASGWVPNLGFAAGGVTLSVHRDDLEQAQKILEEADQQ